MPKRFYFHKLVRDNIVQNCLDDPKILETKHKVLSSQEYKAELIKKILEEASEIPISERADRNEVLAEIADLQKVIDSIRDEYGFTEAEVANEGSKKTLKKGGFSKKQYIEYVTLADDSKWLDIFRAQPDKYIEEEVPAEGVASLTFVTGNRHKAKQYESLLGVPIFRRDIDLEEIQSVDPIQVALHKIGQAFEVVQAPVIVDDFGLYMAGLNDLPGPLTKFFTAHDSSMENLCKIAKALDNRDAKVIGVIAYKDANQTKVFVSETPGKIASSPRGSNGIHSDLIFEPDGYGGRTRAELNLDEYAEVYMQTRPLAELREFLSSVKSEDNND